MYSKHFNSHAHVERDLPLPILRWIVGISTHTLTWSVTALTAFFCVTMLISTHTLTWSVTERDDNDISTVHISTHTLTWSVTVSWRAS